MDARLERNLRLLLAVVACGASAGLFFSVTQHHSAIVGVGYGVAMSGTLGAIELFIFNGPMRDWLSRFSFTAAFAIRSAIYAAIIALLQWLQPGELIAGLPPNRPARHSGTASSIPPRSQCSSISVSQLQT